MNKMIALLKKTCLALLILGIGILALPSTPSLAAGLNDTGTPPAAQPANARLEQAWGREQQAYQRQADLLGKADGLISKVQALINKASAKGWDTNAVQAALNAFQAAVQDARAVHAGGAALIASHPGFDENGKVVDRTQALETVKGLHQVLQDTRTAMNGTGKALRAAIQALRDAHKSSQSSPAPAPTNP